MTLRRLPTSIFRSSSNPGRRQQILTHDRPLRLYATTAKCKDDSQIVSSPFPDVDIPKGVTVLEYMKAGMGPWIDNTAFECAITRRAFTFRQIFQMSRSFGAALIHAGFQHGDVIGVILPNVPEYAPIIYGIWEAGLIASPVNPNYTQDEIRRQLQVANAVAAVTSAEYLPAIRDNVKFIVSIDQESIPNTHSFYEMIKTDPSWVNFPPVTEDSTQNHTSLLPFSSGTTGLPKGVCLTQYNLLANLIQTTIPSYSHRRDRYNPPERQRFIGVLPFFHSYGVTVFLHNGVYQGCHTLTIPKFDPDIFLQAVRHHRPTSLFLVPPLVNLILNSKDYGRKELDSVGHIVLGAAPIGRSLIDSLVAKKGCNFDFMEGYGMTELSPTTHLTPLHVESPVFGSCGVPVPNTMTKIIDVTTGETLGRNQRGEICIKGPQAMKGYWKNEKATQETIDEDGWVHTGDIAYYDDDGNCYIVDRLKELVKVKGFQVAPAELEDILRRMPGIKDVAVIGIPDTEAGQVPRAYVVRGSDSNLTEQDVYDFLHPLVSHYKHLKGGIEFIKAIPKAPTGKILRKELVADYEKSYLIKKQVQV